MAQSDPNSIIADLPFKGGYIRGNLLNHSMKRLFSSQYVNQGDPNLKLLTRKSVYSKEKIAP